MKKVELHCHIDGSVRIQTAWELQKERNLHLADDFPTFEKQMRVSKHCHSLKEYLACFDPVLAILQDEDALYRVTYELIEDLWKEDVIYAELRFAPAQHTKKGASQETILTSVIKAIEDAKQTMPQIRINLILCMMVLGDEANTHEDNVETLRLAIQYHHKGVCALDLAGAEGSAPFQAFMPFFMEAKLNGLPYTIHAGENPYPKHVELAIIMGTQRIGHGIASIHDPSIIQFLIEKQIPLEICPSSNLHCDLIANMETHPIKELMKQGVLVTINTDNRTISNTTLENEYQLLKKHLQFSDEDIKKCNQTAIEHSFLSIEEKELLLSKLS